MAVVLEFASVILRKSAVERDIPGGLDAVTQLSLPNLAEDEHLLRVGFMSTSEAAALISSIVALGSRDGLALVQWGVLPHPEWISVGMVDDQAACWLAGTPPGALARVEQNRMLLCFGITEARILESLGAIARIARSERVADGDLQLAFARDDALIDVRVMADEARCAIMLDRQPARRRCRAVDVALLDDLTGVLSALGAQPLT